MDRKIGSCNTFSKDSGRDLGQKLIDPFDFGNLKVKKKLI